ncbi:MAG: hypothetical protein HUU37_06670 [Bdellovibrionales bacterium]|nr:hypothetical protein [Bdellovibrionales bacterium]
MLPLSAAMEDSGATKRITANLPVLLLSAAQAATGEGITETLVRGMDMLFRVEAGAILARMQGRMLDRQVLFADAAALSAWLTGKEHIPILDFALLAGALRVPDIVAAEVAARPEMARFHKELHQILFRVPKLPTDGSRWVRVASLKAHLEAKGRRVSTVDAELIQAAMDHGAALVVRNPALRDVHKVFGVKLDV